MNRLPEPTPTAPAAGQPTPEALYDAHQLAAAVESIYQGPTSFRDTSPIPAIGTAPPVLQPGRPPMSPRAVDLNTTILTSTVFTAVASGGITGILWASGHADPSVVGCIVAAPAALAVPIFALSRLVKRVKETVEAAPPVIHQHYTGTVIQDQRTVNTTTRGIVASTRNQLPSGTSEER